MGDDTRLAWWGEWDFGPRQRRHWRVGPLDLWIQRLEHEWLFERARSDDPLDASLSVARVDSAAVASADAEIDRVATDATRARIALTPRLADRDVIVRPAQTLHVLPGTRIRLFVSSPLWIRIGLSSGDAMQLLELPIYRPSDTWFGPSTLSGKRAYAIQTSCRLDVSSLPFRPHRAVTPIEIDNASEDRLIFERLAVPVTRLSLYRSEDDRLWTDSLQVRHRQPGSGLADVSTRPGGPSEAGACELVSGPREVDSAGVLRIFEELF